MERGISSCKGRMRGTAALGYRGICIALAISFLVFASFGGNSPMSSSSCESNFIFVSNLQTCLVVPYAATVSFSGRSSSEFDIRNYLYFVIANARAHGAIIFHFRRINVVFTYDHAV